MGELTTRVQGIPLGLQAAQVLRLLIDEKFGRFDFGLVVGSDSTSWCRCLYCDGHLFLVLWMDCETWFEIEIGNR